MRFWDFPGRSDEPRNDQINEQSSRWSHLGRKSDEIWCDFDWIQMVDKQWDSSIKDFREPPQLRKWSSKGQKWWKMVKIGFWEAPRSEFGYRLIGIDRNVLPAPGPKWAQNGRKRCFEGVFEQMGLETWHTRPNQTSKTRKIAKIAKMMKKWVFDKICKMKIEKKSSKCTKVCKSVYINAHMSLSQGFWCAHWSVLSRFRTGFDKNEKVV